MMIGKKMLSLAAVGLMSAAAFQSHAETKDFEILVGQTGNFAFSYLHTATKVKKTVNGVDYWTGGTTLFELSGTISGTWDGSAVKLNGVGGTLDAKVLNKKKIQEEFGITGVTTNEDWDLVITGGSIEEATNGFAQGSLTYDLQRGDGSSVNSGTFYFDPIGFIEPVNTINASQVALWGNNWDAEGGASKPGSEALGIDLVGTSSENQVVPTPTALGAGLAGIALLAGRRRRDSRSSN